MIKVLFQQIPISICTVDKMLQNRVSTSFYDLHHSFYDLFQEARLLSLELYVIRAVIYSWQLCLILNKNTNNASRICYHGITYIEF